MKRCEHGIPLSLHCVNCANDKRADRLPLSKYLCELDEAERQAWVNLGRYKFWMFGYFAGRWVFLNRMLNAKRPNPFKDIVLTARKKCAP